MMVRRSRTRVGAVDEPSNCRVTDDDLTDTLAANGVVYVPFVPIGAAGARAVRSAEV